jgi:cysteine desulfurase / selenocysteine lyase
MEPNFEVSKVRADFPILAQTVNGKPLIYLDNAATTQKPMKVIQGISDFYSHSNSNIHRGVHHLSQESTRLYEEARKKVRHFIGAAHDREIVFTAGATASINAIASAFADGILKAGDEILLSEMEHHANIVPWQLAAQRKGCTIKVIPMDPNGDLILDQPEKYFTDKTAIAAITHVSNSLGTINPIAEFIRVAHQANIPVLIDAAQSIQHLPINVQELDCDFLVFSGHKVYAPTGIGVLYGKEKWLDKLPPYQGGGDMIDHVSFERTTYNQLPFKFEAGTMNYVGAHALGLALDYLNEVGRNQIGAYEQRLFEYAKVKLQEIDGIQFIGNATRQTAVISFLIDQIHQYDMGMILDKMGIALRTGTHCNEPVMTHFGIDGTVRASFAFYNTMDEIDSLINGLQKVKFMLG